MARLWLGLVPAALGQTSGLPNIQLQLFTDSSCLEFDSQEYTVVPGTCHAMPYSTRFPANGTERAFSTEVGSIGMTRYVKWTTYRDQCTSVVEMANKVQTNQCVRALGGRYVKWTIVDQRKAQGYHAHTQWYDARSCTEGSGAPLFSTPYQLAQGKAYSSAKDWRGLELPTPVDIYIPFDTAPTRDYMGTVDEDPATYRMPCFRGSNGTEWFLLIPQYEDQRPLRWDPLRPGTGECEASTFCKPRYFVMKYEFRNSDSCLFGCLQNLKCEVYNYTIDIDRCYDLLVGREIADVGMAMSHVWTVENHFEGTSERPIVAELASGAAGVALAGALLGAVLLV